MTTAQIIEQAAKDAGVNPNDPVFRAKLFKRLWEAGLISEKPNAE